jgi:hypothetical protein
MQIGRGLRLGKLSAFLEVGFGPCLVSTVLQSARSSRSPCIRKEHTYSVRNFLINHGDDIQTNDNRWHHIDWSWAGRVNGEVKNNLFAVPPACALAYWTQNHVRGEVGVWLSVVLD